MMTLDELKQIYIGFYHTDDIIPITGVEYDHHGFGRKIYVGDSWYHLNFSLMIDDIGGPVTEHLIEELEDCLSWSDLETAKARKEQLHKAADVPPGWFYMSDWVSAE